MVINTAELTTSEEHLRRRELEVRLINFDARQMKPQRAPPIGESAHNLHARLKGLCPN